MTFIRLFCILLCVGGTYARHAQETSFVQTSLTPNHKNVYVVEKSGTIDYAIGGEKYACEYMIRYPERMDQWNGRVVIGWTGRIVDHVWYWWLNLDDLIGRYATEQGYAYASIDAVPISKPQDAQAVNTQFTDFVKRQIQTVYGKAPMRTYVIGVSNGGTFVRTVAERNAPPFDGALIISGGGGDLPGWLDRQALLLRQWPGVDPQKNPNLPDTDRRVKAYAEAVGTPIAAREHWRMLTSGLTTASLRTQLMEGGLDGLSDDQVQRFQVKDYRKNRVFMDSLASANSTGHLTVPTIEIVGTYDDLVYPEVTAYAGKVRQATQKGKDSLYRLYQISTVWSMGSEDNFWMSEGKAYRGVIEQSLAALNQWASSGALPPPDRVIEPERTMSASEQKIDRLTADQPLILTDVTVAPSFTRVLEDARLEAKRLNSPEIGTEHLLLSLLKQDDLAAILRNQGMAIEAVQRRVTPGKRRSSGIDFTSSMAGSFTIFTVKPVDGTKEHQGAWTHLTRTEMELRVGETRRRLSFDHIVGQVTIRHGDGQTVNLDAMQFIKDIKRWTLDPQWVLTTSQAIDGAREHLITFSEMTLDHLTGLVDGKERTIPYSLITKTEIIDTGELNSLSSAQTRWSTDLKQIFKLAIDEAKRLRQERVDARNLLNALVLSRTGPAKAFFDEYDIRYEKLNPVAP